MFDRQQYNASPAVAGNPLFEAGRLFPFPLSGDECRELDASVLPGHACRPGAELIREGDSIDRLYFMAEGWAYRYQTTRDGSRQIVGLVIPGGLANLASLTPGRSDFSVRTLTPTKIIAFSIERLNGLAAQHAGIARTLLRLTLADNAILSRWTLCLGRKSAEQRLAHLICELGLRLARRAPGLATFDLPLTQEQIADTLGLTSVHVNRMMQNLRTAGLVATRGRLVTICDMPGLHSLAEFDPTYLRS